MGHVGMSAVAESTGELDVVVGSSERIAELTTSKRIEGRDSTRAAGETRGRSKLYVCNEQERALKLFHTLTAAAFIAAAASGPALAIDISGAGATFPYPIYAKWADAYKKETGNGLNYQSIGSGGGIKQIKAKTVTFGASDAPLPGKELGESGLIQFPTVMGGTVPVGKIDGIKAGDIVIDGPRLARMFMGES